MNATHIVGVDPGLVHTGVVSLLFQPQSRVIEVAHLAVPGPDAPAVSQFINKMPWFENLRVFVEDYKPRSHFSTDGRMTQAVQDMKRILNGTVVNNTGVKKVVKRQLMELVGCWKFGTVTHHQDLRSAAYIALYGMLKDEVLNRTITDVVKAHLAGRTWHVHHA